MLKYTELSFSSQQYLWNFAISQKISVNNALEVTRELNPQLLVKAIPNKYESSHSWNYLK